MGSYRSPERIINRSGEMVNQQVNSLFNEMNSYFKTKQLENEKIKQKNKLNKLKGRKEWQTKLSQTTPEQGFSKEMMRQLRDWGDEYYSLYGKTDSESLRRLDQLLTYPEQLAKTQGVISANMPAYDKAVSMSDPNGPDAVNYNTSWSDGLNILADVRDNNGANFTIQEVFGDDGEADLVWSFPDAEGNTKQVNNGELVKYSEGGKLMFDVNGNIDNVMLQYVNGPDGEGGWKSLIDYDKGIKDIRKTPTSKTTSLKFNEKNEQLKQEAYNADMSSTLGNADLMNSIWPQLTSYALQNKPELIYGPDGKPGGDDDLVSVNEDGSPKIWFSGSDNDILAQQQKVAKSIMIERMFDPAYAATYGIQEDRVLQKERGSTSPPSPPKDESKFTDYEKKIYNQNKKYIEGEGIWDANEVVKDLNQNKSAKDADRYITGKEYKGTSHAELNVSADEDERNKKVDDNAIYYVTEDQDYVVVTGTNDTEAGRQAIFNELNKELIGDPETEFELGQQSSESATDLINKYSGE